MTAQAPAAFHVMAKPTGARCNLACDYCFFLEKADLYLGGSFTMSDEIMEAYIRQTIEAQQVPDVTIAWQGGEPTLMGLDFFRRVVEVEQRYRRPGMTIENTIQTNGVLLDREWADFLRGNRFLVGLSLDGPRELHDAYRHDRAGNSVFDRVVRAARLMQDRGVEFNILCTVNAANVAHPLEVYRFFRDELKTPFLQFIPIIEVLGDARLGQEAAVGERSVGGPAYGEFLTAVFREWVRRDVGEMFVQTFDGTLAAYAFGQSSLCVFRSACGEALVLEHTGDLFSCDHFVTPEHLLGNIADRPIGELAASDKQGAFGRAKGDLPHYCHECEWEFACHGECPKNRIDRAPNGEPGLNWLCAGLKTYFARTERPMRLMADLLAQGREARDVMPLLAREAAATSRNDPCLCGSGRKYKKCCGVAS